MIKNITCVKKYVTGAHFYEISIETQGWNEDGSRRIEFYRFTLHQPNPNQKSVQLFFNPNNRQREEGGNLKHAIRVTTFSGKYWYLHAANALIAKAIGKATEFVTTQELKQASAASVA